MRKSNLVRDIRWILLRRIREETGILTGAVGLISERTDADEIISLGKADNNLYGAKFLRHPYWPLAAAKEFGFSVDWPVHTCGPLPAAHPAPAEISRHEQIRTESTHGTRRKVRRQIKV